MLHRYTYSCGKGEVLVALQCIVLFTGEPFTKCIALRWLCNERRGCEAKSLSIVCSSVCLKQGEVVVWGKMSIVIVTHKNKFSMWFGIESDSVKTLPSCTTCRLPVWILSHLLTCWTTTLLPLFTSVSSAEPEWNVFQSVLPCVWTAVFLIYFQSVSFSIVALLMRPYSSRFVIDSRGLHS